MDSNLSSCSNSASNPKKFANLPNFVSDELKPTSQIIINGHETELFGASEAQQHELDSSELKPSCLKHLNTRKKKSVSARRRYVAPENKSGLKLDSVVGYNGKHASVNMIWNPEREFFAFSLGSVVCVEDLKSGKQKLLYGHQEDVTCLFLRNDCVHMASASAHLVNSATMSSTSSLQCQINIWDCETFECVIKLFHKNASNITCLSYSSDDRFLISVADYVSPSLVVWSTYDYAAMVCMDRLSYVVHDVAWNPLRCNEFVLCGQDKVLGLWGLEEKPMRSGALRFSELEIPAVICEVINAFDLNFFFFFIEKLGNVKFRIN
jgi:WD40 repeat protein